MIDGPQLARMAGSRRRSDAARAAGGTRLGPCARSPFEPQLLLGALSPLHPTPIHPPTTSPSRASCRQSRSTLLSTSPRPTRSTCARIASAAPSTAAAGSHFSHLRRRAASALSASIPSAPAWRHLPHTTLDRFPLSNRLGDDKPRARWRRSDVGVIPLSGQTGHDLRRKDLTTSSRIRHPPASCRTFTLRRRARRSRASRKSNLDSWRQMRFKT